MLEAANVDKLLYELLNEFYLRRGEHAIVTPLLAHSHTNYQQIRTQML
jgi:hypothetical protein